MHQNAQRHGKIIGEALAQQRQALAAGHLNPEPFDNTCTAATPTSVD
jgi:hypothetical protein